jgi:prepilin-type N-terminal cleavage/methylation domain-containing protein
MKHLPTQQGGFSLVETLVAITILLIVITGPMTISMSTAKSTGYASEQVTAFFLAQEGAEIAQKVRDEVLLGNMTAWSSFNDPSGTYSTCFGSAGCGLELNTNTDATLKSIVNCGTASCKLYYESSGGRSRYTYTASGAEERPYTRTLYFNIVNNDEVKVISEVTWRTGTLRAQQKVRVETSLLNVYGS